MEVVRYLHGSRVARPSYVVMQRFVRRLGVPIDVCRPWSALCVATWTWYAGCQWLVSEILTRYYREEPSDLEETRQAWAHVTSLKADAAALAMLRMSRPRKRHRGQ